jgi:hypothetical protein|tara:strand:+ start:200 stop:622 length:423 start_codon:yes stop_codon:yes gene_type:complete
MNAEYCPHCGFKNVYAAVAPNFCGGCGSPLNKSTASARAAPKASPRAQVKRSPVAPRPTAPQEPEERVPFISKLEYEIQGIEPNKMTVGQLMQEEPSDGPSMLRPQAKGKKAKALTSKEILKESMDVCKSARTKPPEEVE